MRAPPKKLPCLSLFVASWIAARCSSRWAMSGHCLHSRNLEGALRALLRGVGLAVSFSDGTTSNLYGFRESLAHAKAPVDARPVSFVRRGM